MIACKQKYQTYFKNTEHIIVYEPDRQWRSSSFQESKKVRVSRDLWPWPWAHRRCRFTWRPFCASLIAIQPFAWEKRFSCQHKSARVTWPLTLSTPWMHADLESILWKFGGDLAICLREEAICTKVYRQTDGRTDDGRRTIALAHSWNELKIVTN